MVDSAPVLQRFNNAQDRLVLQAADLSLETIASMAQAGAIELDPAYQRRERWDTARQSQLIESFLLNVPVPPIYLAEDEFGKYSVIDGKQRITAIFNFMRNKLVLSDLESFTEVIGFKFRDLPAPLQNALRVRPYLRVVTLLKQSDHNLKYEVFTRLNTGGEPLTPQEIRNVVFRGDFNDMLIKTSEDKFLHAQLKIKNTKSAAYREMLDVEYVLRFLMLVETWQSFSGSFRRSMDEYMKRQASDPNSKPAAFQRVFQDAIVTCELIWGIHAFKRPTESGWRDQFLAGMFDAQMVAVSTLTKPQRSQAVAKRSDVVKRTKTLFFDDKAFEAAVRQATNTPSRIKYRIEAMQSILR